MTDYLILTYYILTYYHILRYWKFGLQPRNLEGWGGGTVQPITASSQRRLPDTFKIVFLLTDTPLFIYFFEGPLYLNVNPRGPNSLFC